MISNGVFHADGRIEEAEQYIYSANVEVGSILYAHTISQMMHWSICRKVGKNKFQDKTWRPCPHSQVPPEYKAYILLKGFQ